MKSATKLTLGVTNPILQWDTLTYLEAAWPGAALLTVQQTAQALGKSEKTIRNELWRNDCPLPPIRHGGKVLFRKVDIARFIDGQVKRKPGAPTKAEKIEANRLGITIKELRAIREKAA